MPSPLDSSLPLPEGEADGGERASSLWPLIAVLFLAAAALLVVQMRRPSAADPLVGHPLPPLDAAGWLNIERPLTANDLRGKIVVIDFWASWCGDCAASMPDLVDFHERYRDQGVMLVGLSPEPPSDLPSIERFVSHFEGADWPIAYGAVLAVEVLGIDAWPTYMLYDRSGRSVWSGWSVADLEEAMVALLARERSRESRVENGKSRAKHWLWSLRAIA
jgi:thiol-disulfide isomerase/thioredoxin